MKKPKQMEKVFDASQVESYIVKKYGLDFDLFDWIFTYWNYGNNTMIEMKPADILQDMLVDLGEGEQVDQAAKEFIVALQHEFGDEFYLYYWW
jgi:hypothetical protein